MQEKAGAMELMRGEGARELEQWGCSDGAGAMELQEQKLEQWSCNNRAGAMEVQKNAGAMELQHWTCSAGSATVGLLPGRCAKIAMCGEHTYTTCFDFQF